LEFLEIRKTFYGTHLWIAYKIIGNPISVIDFYLIQGTKKGKREMDWGYKDMSEDSGPLHYDCPLELLDMTTGTNTEISKEWREKVRHYQNLKSKPLFQIGTVIDLWGDYFKIVGKKKGNKSYYMECLKTGRTYRLPPRQFSSVKIPENTIDFILRD
jgi:hypothetical protein